MCVDEKLFAFKFLIYNFEKGKIINLVNVGKEIYFWFLKVKTKKYLDGFPNIRDRIV